jgi:hypothetical protein
MRQSEPQTHEHHTRVAVSSQVVDVENADLSAFAAMHALDRRDALPDLDLSLGLAACDLLESRSVERNKR